MEDFPVVQRKKLASGCNRELTRVENEIYYSIQYGDYKRLKQLGCGDSVDINFGIEIKTGMVYYPIMIAAVLGNKNVMKLLLENPQLNINVQDARTGVNAFWLAAYYGKGHCL